MLTANQPDTTRSLRDRWLILAALMLSMALVALDSTIVATAVPSVVRQLGGFAQFPWLFSIYLLTQAVTVPLYGKFADVIGRKPVLTFGIGLFLVGSAACGLAWNMTTLIVFRGVQGLGAGAVLPITITIVGDTYTVAERARIQGYLSSVWGISSVIGPTLGGVFSQYLSWRWIFFVNLPVGAAALVMLGRHFHEQVRHRAHRIDLAGAGLLTVGCSLLILGLLQGGVSWGWASVDSIAIFGVAALLLGGFLVAERRAPEPVLPLWVFGHRTLLAGNLAALAIGAILIGLSSYVPTYLQGVRGTGALVAGFALAAMSIGWPLASSVSGRLYIRIGFRDTALVGSALSVGGAVLFATLHQASPIGSVALASFVVGVGLGFSSTALLVAIQSAVGWEHRGVVTGTNMFTRAIGSAVGVAVFGAMVNSRLAGHFRHPPAALAHRLPRSLDTASLVLGGAPPGHDPAVIAFIRHGLYLATHEVYVALVGIAVVGGLCAAIMPRRPADVVVPD